MKALILSDLHLEFAPFASTPDLEFDVVILAGDIHSPAKRAVQWAADTFRGKPVVYVPGNHEYYDGRLDTTLAEARRTAEGTNVHLLDGDEVVIDGVRFLGATLWTDFELAIETPEGPVSDLGRAMRMATNLLNDYALIRTVDESAEAGASRYKQGRKLRVADTARLHQAQRAWLREKLSEPFAGPTVVVTHHAPHRGSLSARYADDWASGAFVTELPDAFFDVPLLWVHGHTHQQFDYRVRSCRIVCNPRGYLNWSGKIENNAFDPALVIDVPTLAKGSEA
ncbi:metallophosphoesterase [Variovorax sp. LT1P1]|uniref:metallophosphoesterase n=1 Tax=Variovorax sp. LT1P1 TaxID=3443730 RepID=UPI003F46C967